MVVCYLLSAILISDFPMNCDMVSTAIALCVVLWAPSEVWEFFFALQMRLMGLAFVVISLYEHIPSHTNT